MPLVSIGFPVYNGAQFLRRALDSIVTQDYTNLEIIISDNASTDETFQICHEYAEKDTRINCTQLNDNIGATNNLNRVIAQSTGKYFMRMSDDDVRAPSYISKCVALLEANDQAVLSHSYTGAFYGEMDNVLSVLTHDSMENIHSPGKRFVEAIKNLPASAIDGIIRMETLKTKAREMGDYISADIVLTGELSLHGEFVQVPEILFWRSGKKVLPGPKAIHGIYKIGKKRTMFHYPFLTLIAQHIKSIFRSPIPATTRPLLVIALLLNEMKLVFAKLLFRTGTALFASNCPNLLITTAVAIVNGNPNVRLQKPFNELPPALLPTWKLLNHRDMDAAISLQEALIKKHFPATDQ